jgi:hypothetical protein
MLVSVKESHEDVEKSEPQIFLARWQRISWVLITCTKLG